MTHAALIHTGYLATPCHRLNKSRAAARPLDYAHE